MISSLALFTLIALSFVPSSTFDHHGEEPSDYMAKRKALIEEDRKLGMGATLHLNEEEKLVNAIIMQEKSLLMNKSMSSTLPYLPALSFYEAKPLIEKTKIFQIIRKMPKGAALHIHDLAAVSMDWLIKNATYNKDLFMCIPSNGFPIFQAFRTPPHNPDCPWKSVMQERMAAHSMEEFDEQLRQNMSFVAVDPVKAYADNQAAWVRFTTFFSQVYHIVYYLPIFKDFMRQVLIECREDNVQYLELRGQLKDLYDIDGTRYDAVFGMHQYKKIFDDFKKEFPDFGGAKIIMNGIRFVDESEIMKEVKIAMKLHREFPNFMLGYDLVGDEVLLHTLQDYISALLYPSQQKPPFNLPYFFHAGETDWQGTPVDYNLADAILLNTTRIGHGFALAKHPKLAQLVKDKQIGLEVCPVSNQLLRLVTDPRDHPMVSLMANQFPIVVSSDDPMCYEILPLSHDFYVAFMDMSGEDGDMRYLKQLALNSLKYSVMTESERKEVTELWQAKWDTFIKETIAEHSSDHTLRFRGKGV